MPITSREKSTAGSVPSLRSVSARQRPLLVAAALLSVVAGAGSLAPYIAVYAVTVALFTPDGGGGQAIPQIAVWTAVAIVGRAVAAGAATHLAHKAAYRILAELRLVLVHALGRLPLGRVQARPAGELKKVLHDDVEQLEEALAHGIPDLAAAVAVPVTTTALLLIVDWRLALVALAALLLLVLVSATGMAMAARNNSELARHVGVLNRAVLGYLQGIKVIRGFLRPDSGYDQAREAIMGAERLNAAAVRGPLKWLVAVMMVATGFAVALLLPVAGLRFAAATVDLATLILFLLIGLCYLTPLISLVGTLATVLTRIQFAARDITSILAERPLAEPARPRVPVGHDIAFRGVGFSYADEGEPLLRDLDLEIAAGTRFAVVGPTGAGKSTIARLVARFWDVSAGAVEIGGVDVREITQADLARLVAYVQQDEYVFAASLRENIRIARPGATDAEVEAAGRAAQLIDLVDTLPDAWDTQLAAGGTSLSGGQRQRISIARALLKDSPVILLDEVTAALDEGTEAAVLAALDSLTAGRTVLSIAHRLHTIAGADRIAYLEGGAIVAQGSHEEVLEASAGYRRLWESYRQASGWRLDAPEGPAPEVVTVAPASVRQDWEARVDRLITPGLGSAGFARQWIILLGHGWPLLLRRGVPRLVLEGLVRGAPLIAVFVIVQRAIAGAADGRRFDTGFVWQVTGVLVAALVFRLLTVQWANATVWSISGHSKMDLQLSVVERLRRVPMGFFSRVDNGRISTLISNDIPMLDFQNVPQQVVAALVQPVYVAIILAILDWRLALATLIGLPVFWLVTAWSDRIYHRVFAAVHDARRETTIILIEQARGAAVLRGNPGSFIATRFEDSVERLRRASTEMSVRAAPAIGLGAVAVESGLVALIALGGWLYSSGQVSAVTLLMFLMLSLTLYQPIQELANLAGYRHNQQQIAAKIADVWDAPVLAEPEVPAIPLDSSVQFEDVWFSYDSTDEDEVVEAVGAAEQPATLRGVTFTMAPGSITALVGPSGAGKSTVANLLTRLWDVDRGVVRIGGQDVRDLGTDAVMRLVTSVYQDVYLFNDTIRYNVSLGRPQAGDDEIWAALRAAQVDDVVAALPAGLDTVVDDGGVSLSGGQRQRLAIARALLKDSPILVLDEAVASVDPDTEARIQEAVGTLAAGRTVLVIAHRRETVQGVDQLIEVRAGQAAHQQAAGGVAAQPT